MGYFVMWHFAIFSHKTFFHKTFRHKTFRHKTFCHKTFCHKTQSICHSTFVTRHLLQEVYAIGHFVIGHFVIWHLKHLNFICDIFTLKILMFWRPILGHISFLPFCLIFGEKKSFFQINLISQVTLATLKQRARKSEQLVSPL